MLRKLHFLIFLLIALAAPAAGHAQIAQSVYGNPPIEVYGGYAYVFRPYDSSSQTPIKWGMNGWDSSVRLPLPLLPNWLGIKGDASGSYRSNGSLDLDPHAYFFLLGPQATAHLRRSTIWAHALAGSALLNDAALSALKSNTTFALALGGGVDFGLKRNIAWRVSLDYFNTHFQSSDPALHELANSNGRVSTGPVWRF